MPWPLPTCLLIAFLVFLAAAQMMYILSLLRARQPPTAAADVASAIVQPPQVPRGVAAWGAADADNNDANGGSQRLRGGDNAVGAAAVALVPPTQPTQTAWWAGVPQLPGLPPVTAGAGRPLLEAWRRRQVDWHDLVPLPNMLGGDTEVAGRARWDALVASELGVLTLLQGFKAGTPGGAADPDAALARREVNGWHAPEALWGPLSKYAACTAVRDKCVVHSTARACVRDELCGWCRSRGVCAFRGAAVLPERAMGAVVPVCDAPLLVAASSLPDAADGTVTAYAMDLGSGDVARNAPIVGGAAIRQACHIFVSRNKHAKVSVTGNAKMAYHFYTENAQDLAAAFGGGQMQTHIYVDPASTDEFLSTFYAFSDSCWRYTHEVGALARAAGDRPLTVCYGNGGGGGGGDEDASGAPPRVIEWNAAKRAPPPGATPFEYADMESEAAAVAGGMRVSAARMAALITASGTTAADALGGVIAARSFGEQLVAAASGSSYPDTIVAMLGLLHVHPTRPLVTLISRRNKRLMLNEPELVAATRGLGVDVVVASLETMPLYEQVLLFRRTTVLVGIHGSGLINSIFMHYGTALVQLMPYRVSSGATFFQRPAEVAGLEYFEWTNTDRGATRTHDHFLGPEHAGRDVDAIIAGASPPDFFSYVINQDTVVNVDEYLAVLRRALNSPVNSQLRSKAV